jgi:hypothetical protein
MNSGILHILEVEVIRDFVLKIKFNDGTVKVIEVKPLLTGQVFEPLHDPDFFARVTIDPVAQTVAWPNGADFAPEALYELTSLEHVA